MATVKGVALLQRELQKAQDKLHDVDENIKKLTGRDPIERGPGNIFQRRSLEEGGNVRGRMFGRGSGVSMHRQLDRRDRSSASSGPRGVGRLFNLARLGSRSTRGYGGREARYSEEDEPDEDKPSLSSSVVTAAESKTRQEALKEQGCDERGKARNRRMFGALLGTLQRFRSEEKTTYSGKEKAREDVEKKLEARANEEREELKKERKNLFQQRRHKQANLRHLEHKMELVKIHEDWVNQTRILMNFVRTKSKPYIFFLPSKHNSASKKRLVASQEILDEVIEARRLALEEELDTLGVRSTPEPDVAPKDGLQRHSDKENDDDDDEKMEEEAPHNPIAMEDEEGESVELRRVVKVEQEESGGQRKSLRSASFESTKRRFTEKKDSENKQQAKVSADVDQTEQKAESSGEESNSLSSASSDESAGEDGELVSKIPVS